MGRTSAIELCQKLKSEATASQDVSTVNNLRLRILEYFITRNVPDDMFEGILKARLNDPDQAKEASKVICGEILEAWQTGHGDRP